MIDREKVIKGLGICYSPPSKCKDCPYHDLPDEQSCNDVLCLDALALLKEQTPVKPVRDKKTGRVWLCGNCGSYVGFEDNDPHDPNEFDKYCRQCGKKVKWDN